MTSEIKFAGPHCSQHIEGLSGPELAMSGVMFGVVAPILALGILFAGCALSVL